MRNLKQMFNYNYNCSTIDKYTPDSDIWAGLFGWVDEFDDDDAPNVYGI